ncbi:hypothetical protein PAPYR_1123 [Paratrimastix pyriformis]|uniref:Uncharacterized protein n=1 Tax=Paratrimastix pyriformis TaxID=342808 RepID=A0ABQ8UTK8_9EUKA|nr:hypothetical protein PAPYR_1123 [Paratrimastix pyriformis]
MFVAGHDRLACRCTPSPLSSMHGKLTTRTQCAWSRVLGCTEWCLVPSSASTTLHFPRTGRSINKIT